MATQQQTASKFGPANIILILGLGMLLCGEAYFGYHLHKFSREQEQLKQDYSTTNNITFGVFSIDQWRERVSAIVHGKVNDYSITAEQKKALFKQVEHALNGLIDKTVAQIDKPAKGIGAKLKKLAFNAMVNTDELHAQVPAFSQTIIDKVTSPESQQRLKNIANSKIGQMENQTYDNTTEVNDTVTKKLYAKYHVTNAADYNKTITTQLAAIRTVTYNYAYAMVGCVVFALCLWLLMRKRVKLQSTLFVMSLLFALVLLLVGVTTSIIEVDARLVSVKFLLLGQNVLFENQVLFFQSKSIWQIVDTLIAQSKPDAVVVGVLIFVFIIILPIVRMVAKGVHILSKKAIAKNKVVTYLAFDSAKWDMADVMVVGILMTYIGLNGILKSQLADLNVHNSVLTTVTANDTSLQPGYFIFVGYVAFALILGYILKKITPYNIV